MRYLIFVLLAFALGCVTVQTLPDQEVVIRKQQPKEIEVDESDIDPDFYFTVPDNSIIIEIDTSEQLTNDPVPSMGTYGDSDLITPAALRTIPGVDWIEIVRDSLGNNYLRLLSQNPITGVEGWITENTLLDYFQDSISGSSYDDQPIIDSLATHLIRISNNEDSIAVHRTAINNITVSSVSSVSLSTFGDSIVIDAFSSPVIRIPIASTSNMTSWNTAKEDTVTNRVANIILYGDSNTEFIPNAFTIPIRDLLTNQYGNAGYGWMNMRTDVQDHVDLNALGTWHNQSDNSYGLYALDGFDRTWHAESNDGLEYEFTPSSLASGATAAKESAQCKVVEFHYYGYSAADTVRYEITNPTAGVSRDTFVTSVGYNVYTVDLPEYGYHDATFQIIGGDSLRALAMNFTTYDTIGRSGAIVHRIGHSGATAGNFHYIPDTLFQQQIQNLRADLIIFNLGGNNYSNTSAARSELDSLINKVRVWNDTVSIALLVPSENTAVNATDLGKIHDRNYWYLSRKHRTAFGSLFQLHGDRTTADSMGLFAAPGNAHYSNLGGRVNADFICRQILGAYGASSSGGSSSIAIGSEVSGASSGGVLYTDGVGQLQQDATEFYIDPSTKAVGIGTSSPKGAFQVEGNIGMDVGLQAVNLGSLNLDSVLTANRAFANGSMNFKTANQFSYSFVNGFENGQNATNAHDWIFINGLRNLQNTTGSTYTFANGNDNFKSSTGLIRYSFANGDGNFETNTGAHTYNFASGLANADLASGSYIFTQGAHNFGSFNGSLSWVFGVGQDNFLSLTSSGNYNIGIGLENFEQITSGEHNLGLGRRVAKGASDLAVSHAIGIGYEALNSHTGQLDNTIAIGFEAGKSDSEDNNILIGTSVTADANDQIVLGGTTYTQFKSRNYRFNIDQDTSGLHDYVLTYDSTANEIQLERAPEFGSESTTTDGSGDVTVTFANSYSSAPIIIVTSQTAGHHYAVTASTTTTFTVRVSDGADSALTSTSVDFNWMAK